jgi:hypothetical protein
LDIAGGDKKFLTFRLNGGAENLAKYIPSGIIKDYDFDRGPGFQKPCPSIVSRRQIPVQDPYGILRMGPGLTYGGRYIPFYTTGSPVAVDAFD